MKKVVLAAALAVGAARPLTMPAQGRAPASIQAQQPARTTTSTKAAPVRTNIPYADAKPILDALREDLLPSELLAKTPAERQSLWPRWVARRDVEIRARLERGDEDSVVNFLWFGVTFTKLPRSQLADLLAGAPAGIDLLKARIDDMTAGIATPGANERLRFVRQVVQRKGIDPSSATSQDRVRSYLLELTNRVLADIVRYDPTIQAAAVRDSTLFRDRGLASDTAISSDFSIDQALEAAKAKGLLIGKRAWRVAVVGPGLDFVDKYEGYDFYPEQTIQPFALIDSLMRLGLAKAGDIRMTTFDLSPRVNRHIEAARQRARAGSPYVIHLPRDKGQAWSPALVGYWERLGNAIGGAVKTAPAVSAVDNVEVREVPIAPSIVVPIVARDLNIVLQRLAPLSNAERFDLVVATNILVYYDVFEQSLALANLARMLQPGGVFLCNDALPLLPSTPIRLVGYTDVVYNTELKSGDRVWWYQRN